MNCVNCVKRLRPTKAESFFVHGYALKMVKSSTHGIMVSEDFR